MSELIKLCVTAVGLLLDAETVALDRAEDFSDLKPPRVRVSVEYTRGNTEANVAAILDLLEGSERKEWKPTPRRSGFFRCTFKGTDLVEICPQDGCLFQNETRVEEIRALLKREQQGN